jgi:hypothetical protein
MVIAANKMDTEEAQQNYEEIIEDEDYSHLTIVPCSAHAEKALKNADEKGKISYIPGSNDFDIEEDLSEGQEKGLEEIREFIGKYGGTGVQSALEKALFDELGVIAVFPGGEKLEDEHGNTLPDCFLIPEESTAEDFAFEIHSDIGEGFLHGKDIREMRQIGSDHELEHRDVIEIITSN